MAPEPVVEEVAPEMVPFSVPTPLMNEHGQFVFVMSPQGYYVQVHDPRGPAPKRPWRLHNPPRTRSNYRY